MKSFLFRTITSAIAMLVVFIIQFTLVPYVELGAARPNLLLIAVVSAGFLFGIDEGLTCGIFAGIYTDMMFSSILALYVLIYVTIGYTAGVASKIYFGEAKRVFFAAIFCEELIYGLVIYVIFFLFRGRFFVFRYLIGNIIPSAIYTAFVAIILSPVIMTVYRRYKKQLIRKEDYFA